MIELNYKKVYSTEELVVKITVNTMEEAIKELQELKDSFEVSSPQNVHFDFDGGTYYVDSEGNLQKTESSEEV